MLNSAQSAEVKDDSVAENGAEGANAAAIEQRKIIEATLAAIRPNLQRDKGDCELIDVQGDKVFVRMTGACVGCQLSSMTLNGVQAKLVEATGRMIRLIPVGGNLPHL